MSQTSMEDYEIFGGEAPDQTPEQRRAQMMKYAQPQQQQQAAAPQQGPQGARPAPQGAGSSIADTAAAVARRKKEADRTALIHEVMLIVGFLAVLGVGWVIYGKWQDKKAEAARQAHEYQMQEQAAREQRDKARREEDLKRRQEKEAKQAAEKAKREAEKAARKKQLEDQRLAQEKTRRAAERFRSLREVYKNATIDYYRNAVDAERPDKVGAEALFVCMFAGGGDGCDFYEVRTDADGKMTAQRLSASGEPEPIDDAKFKEKLGSAPCLVYRDRGQADGNRLASKAYLLDPTRGKRGVTRPQPAPQGGEAYSPSKLDFGGLYDAVLALGSKKTAFRYRVYVRGGGLVNPVLVKDAALGEEIGQGTFREAVKAELEKTSRGRAVTAADADSVLRQARVTFKAERD